MHYLLFIMTALIWGSAFFLMKIASSALGPITIGASSTFGGAIVLAIVWFYKKYPWQITKKQIIPVLIIAFLGYIFPYSAQPFLVSKIGHGFVGMMVSLVPILTILVSIPLLKIYPSKTQLVCVLIGLVSIGLMVIDGLDRSARFTYLIMAVSVPLFYAISNILIQKYFRNTSPLVLVTLFMAITAAVLTPLALSVETITVDDHFPLAMGAILLLSVFARGLAMLFFYRLIQDKGPLFAGMVTYVIPIEALLWSWLDGETITPVQIASITLILLVVGIVQRDISARQLK